MPPGPTTSTRRGSRDLSAFEKDQIETLFNKPMNAGYHEIEFNAHNLSSGIYFYRIEAGEFQDVKKMVLLRWHLIQPTDILSFPEQK